jgi:signal peptidase I
MKPGNSSPGFSPLRFFMVTAKKKPLLAGFFSLIIPGLGQVYNGELRKGIIFYTVGYVLILLVSLFSLPFTFLGLILFIFLALSWPIFALIDAVKTAKKSQLMPFWPYNKYYVYLLIFITVSILDYIPATLCVESYSVSSGSMEPTNLIGDYILVNKLSYGILNPLTNQIAISWGKPHRGDVIVLDYPLGPRKSYIKRVVGLPGDRIHIIDKRLYLNGQLSEFPVFSDNLYTTRPVYRDWKVTTTPRDNFGPVVVPQGAYFVMGDNRDYSYDSRFWGFIPSANLRGKATYIYFSKNPEDSRIRWDRIGRIID